MAIMLYRQAAQEVGLTQYELYNGLRSGKYPGARTGGSKGRWLVDTDLLRNRLSELMNSNVKQEDQEETMYGKIRKVK